MLSERHDGSCRSFARRSSLNSKEHEQLLLNYTVQNLPTESVILDIGCGTGVSTVDLALASPDSVVLACEPYMPSISVLLNRLSMHNITNVLIWSDDYHDLLPLIYPKSVVAVYVLFPDPWPKRAHQRRRLINKTFIDEFIVKMTDNGKLVIGSDSCEYIKHTHSIVSECKKFDLSMQDKPFNSYTYTKYHCRALRYGRKVDFIVCTVKS